MTDVRKVPINRGAVWFIHAINLGTRNPRAIFGAALLFLGTLYGLGFLFVLPAAATLDGKPDLSRVLMALVPFFLLLMFLFPILMGGLMHVIHEAEAGRPVRARDLFAPIRQRKAGPLAMLGLIQIGLTMAGAMIVVALAGPDYWRDYLDAVRAAMAGSVPVPPQPRHPGLLMLVQMAFNYFSYAIMLFCVPLVLFSGDSLSDAVKHSLRASISNIGANLLAAVLFGGGVVLAALVTGVLAVLAGLVGSLLHPVVGVALSLLLYIALGTAVLVILMGGTYLAWRDTFADGAVPPAVADASKLEA
ncbi:MAG TPA: hypothetical protein VGD42_13880 [Lysobacter sp.]